MAGAASFDGIEYYGSRAFVTRVETECLRCGAVRVEKTGPFLL